jgi:hypothetical protein
MTTVPAGEAKPTLICDIEIYKRRLYIGFTRVGDGKHVGFNATDTIDFDRERLRRIMLQNRIVTYNGQGFDVPLIFYCISGATIAEIKLACDRIINGRVRYWDVEKLLNIAIPRIDHIDLIEPQPNAFASLKTLQRPAARHQDAGSPLHPPDAALTDEEMDRGGRLHGQFDLDATEPVLERWRSRWRCVKRMATKYGLELPLEVRRADRRGDHQEAGRADHQASASSGSRRRPARRFPTRPPDRICVRAPGTARAILDRLRTTEFFVQDERQGRTAEMAARADHDRRIDLHHGHRRAALDRVQPGRAFRLRQFARRLRRGLLLPGDHPQLRLVPEGARPRLPRRLSLTSLRKARQPTSRSAAKRAGDKIMAEGSQDRAERLLREARQPILDPLRPASDDRGHADRAARPADADRARRGGAGIPVVSGTRTAWCSAARATGRRPARDHDQWEQETGFELEATEYRVALHQSVNSYIAVKEDGKAKRKGPADEPASRDDMRDQLMNNPNMGVCADAVVDYLTKGTPVEETIRACTDIRDFVTVVNVKGGGTWRGEYLGKVVRYSGHTTATRSSTRTRTRRPETIKKVSLTEGCRPLMDLPSALPADIDYSRYVEHAREILIDIGATRRPIEVKKPRVLKARRRDWLVLGLVG